MKYVYLCNCTYLIYPNIFLKDVQPLTNQNNTFSFLCFSLKADVLFRGERNTGKKRNDINKMPSVLATRQPNIKQGGNIIQRYFAKPHKYVCYIINTLCKKINQKLFLFCVLTA